jgi:hypothetical protein
MYALVFAAALLLPRAIAAPHSTPMPRVGTWAQYPAQGLSLGAMVEGSTGAAMWATDTYDHSLEHITADGTTTGQLPLHAIVGRKTYVFDPYQLTLGADKRFYVTGCPQFAPSCGVLVMVATTGKEQTSKPPPSGDRSAGGIALGPDGNVWFGEYAHIAKIDITGAITEFAFPSKVASRFGYESVAVGSDHRVWFTVPHGNVAQHNSYVGAIDPATGVVHFYLPIEQQQCAAMYGLTLARDGNLYTVCSSWTTVSQSVVSIAPSGKFTYYPFSGIVDTVSNAIQGPDGNVWFAAIDSSKVGYGIFDIAAHTVREIESPFTANGQFTWLANGPQGTVWALQGGLRSSSPSYFVRYTP